MRDGVACVSPMCVLDSFEDKLGLWHIGVPDRMLRPGWRLVPRVRSGTAKVRIVVRTDEIWLTVRGGANRVHEEVRALNVLLSSGPGGMSVVFGGDGREVT